ncbi:MAG: type IV pilus biogenesis/stability protein PilW [Pseudomonadota bacterium]|nr:type IV pilus biogenesis/stability protein PilW [Pseudomonadota bacterium]
MLLLVCLCASGCSRLTFVRPSVERQDYQRVAPEYNVSDSRATKQAASARVSTSMARQHLTQGDLVAAEKLARQALDADPRSEQAHTLLAVIHDRQGNRGKAGEHYRRATELAPGSGAALNNYGTWLCGMGRADESLEWFDRALADNAYRTPAAALANGGACALQAGVDDRAETYSRAAIEIDPGNPVALATLSARAFQNGRALEARAFSERRLAAAPADAQALLLASQIEEKLGDTDAAARYVQRLRAEFPKSSGSGTGDDGRQ